MMAFDSPGMGRRATQSPTLGSPSGSGREVCRNRPGMEPVISPVAVTMRKLDLSSVATRPGTSPWRWSGVNCSSRAVVHPRSWRLTVGSDMRGRGVARPWEAGGVRR